MSGVVDDPSAPGSTFHLGFALCTGLPLLHNTRRRSTEHNLTALHATLTTREEALDRCEFGLAARQQRIEGMDGRVGEV